MRLLPPRRKQRGFIIDPFRFGGGATNPYFSDVVLFTHLDASPFVCVVGNNFSSVVGAPVASTSTKVFGAASLSLNGGSSVTSASSASYAWGTGDFVVEGFTYWNSLSGFQTIFGPSSIGATLWPRMASGTNTLVCARGSGGGANLLVSGAVLTTSAWYYWAWARASGTSRLYGGLASGSTVPLLASASDSTNYVTTNVMLGAYGGADQLNGYIDEFRMTKGGGRAAAGYTGSTIPVPTAAFPNS